MNTIADNTRETISANSSAGTEERQIQQLNYNTFISVMAEMMQKYASKVLK